MRRTAHKFSYACANGTAAPIFIDGLGPSRRGWHGAYVFSNAFVCRSHTIIGFRDHHNFSPHTHTHTHFPGAVCGRPVAENIQIQTHNAIRCCWQLKDDVCEEQRIANKKKDANNANDGGKNAQFPSNRQPSDGICAVRCRNISFHLQIYTFGRFVVD